jgi:hypothetical protein
MKRKLLDTVDEMKSLIKFHSNAKFWVDWYGAYEIDPKHLVIWICVETDELKHSLSSNPELLESLKATLIKFDYPQEARPFVHIGFESQETVNRESGGSWYTHFK